MHVSIIIPTFNRKSFSELISLNIKTQTYPFIKNIIIADDGADHERLVLDVPYTVLYYKVDRMSIGEKRNFLISKCDTEYVACMDTDDMYNPEYISQSIFNLIKFDKDVSGSADMNMYRDGKTYKQRCLYIDMINEATLVFKKAYADTHQFSFGNSSEGVGFLAGNIGLIHETNIDDIMVCVAHQHNTVSKSAWTVDKYAEQLDMSKYSTHLKLLSTGII